MKSSNIGLATLALLVASPIPSAAARAAPGEKIESFHCSVIIQPDDSLLVQEEFRVRSEGSYFRYGMYRFLPIDANDRWDRRFAGEYKEDNGVRVRVLEVLLNGARIPYEQGTGPGSIQLRLGAKDTSLPPGDYSYVIRYTVTGALALRADHDELYWNALGHNWSLPVDEATVTVHVPLGTPSDAVRVQGYGGRRGDIGGRTDANIQLARGEDLAGGISYVARGLGPAQSLSIAVTWPKGFVQPPKFGIPPHEHKLLLIPAALLAYYLLAWMRVGRNPPRGAIVPRYEPPKDLSPAAVRYIRTAGSDARSLAAVVAQLANRRAISIEPHGRTYRLARLMSDAEAEKKLTPEEAKVLYLLFAAGESGVIDPGDNQKNAVLVEAIQDKLRKRLGGVYFTDHFGYIFLGVLGAFVAAMVMAFTSEGRDKLEIGMMTGWFMFVGLVLGAIISANVIPAWKNALRGMASWRKVGLSSLGLLVFLGMVAAIGYKVASQVSATYCFILVALVVINVVCAPTLKRITKKGAQALDEMEGFRQFLVAVEQDELNRLNAPNLTPQMMSDYLPYAIALDVKEAWGDHLADSFFATTSQR